MLQSLYGSSLLLLPSSFAAAATFCGASCSLLLLLVLLGAAHCCHCSLRPCASALALASRLRAWPSQQLRRRDHLGLASGQACCQSHGGGRHGLPS